MHLFLSPHFDDAVLSCGGTIHQLAQSGERVTVLTLMGGAPPNPLPDTPIVRDLHSRWQAGSDPVATRRSEDQVAITSLGAAVDYLPIPDCVYRTADGVALYPSEESLFGAVHPQDDATQAVDLVVVSGDSLVYAPLGVGSHVDHQIARNWGLALKTRFPSLVLRFYEEYPYTRNAAALDPALDKLGALPVELEVAQLTDDNVFAKIHAIACYRTQISTFWADLHSMEQDVRQTLLTAGNGVYAERYWRVID